MTLATVGKPSPRSGANKAGPGPAPGSFQRLHQSVPGTQRPFGAGQANTIGFFNSFFGLNAGQSNTTERENTTLSAGTVNSTQYNINGNRVLSIPGLDNTFVGLSTGAANSSGISNSFFGRSAGINNDDGNFNSFFGVGAGFSNVSGSENSSFGFQSGNTFASGNDNSFFGYRAGLSSTGNNQTLIGANANVGTPGLVN